MEGAVTVYNLFDINVFNDHGMSTTSHPLHAKRDVQIIFLKMLGVGDVVFGVIGAFGLWANRNSMLPLAFEAFRGLHSQIATNCVKALLIWRIAVMISVAPMLGLSMADVIIHITWQLVLACLYLAFSVFTVVGIAVALGVVAEESHHVQREFDLEDAGFRQVLGDSGAMFKEQPLALGNVPWVLLVFLWTMAMGSAAFVWSIRLWTRPQHAIGGWAAAFNSVSFVPSTHWIEVILYNLTWVMAICGVAAIMTFNVAWSLEATVRHNLAGPQRSPLVYRDLIWELERAEASKWQGTVAMQVFFVFSLMRIALFFPITGMSLFEMDVCGFYVSVLSRNYSAMSRIRATSSSCTGEDVRGLVWMCVFLVVDLSTLVGAYKVWCYYYFLCGTPLDKIPSYRSGTLSYGAADDAEALAPSSATASPPPSEPEAPAPAEARAEDEDALCPGIRTLPTDFVIALDSFRKLSAGIFPVPVLSTAGEAILHMRLPATPVQGYAVGGRGAWLELSATERGQPQAAIGPLPRGVLHRRSAEIRGRAGESYGELTPVSSGWEVQRRGRTMLAVSALDAKTMGISASLPDGRVIAKGAAAGDNSESVGLNVDAGNDTLLVLLCVLAVIVMSPRPSMLLHLGPSLTAPVLSGAAPAQPAAPAPSTAAPAQPAGGATG